MSIIKPKRGTGSPAGSIETNEIAMDTAAKTLYVSTTGSNAEILANNTEYFLDNNTISGITAETASYSAISKFSRVNNNANYTLASLEVERELGSSDPATGLDQRGVGFTFTVKSDNYANIFPGAFYGKSGGKDQLAGVENAVGMSVYGGAADSYAETTVLEANKNLVNIYPETLFADAVTINGGLITNSTTGFAGASKFKRATNNSTTNAKASGAFESNYVDSNGALVAPTAGAGAATGWLVNNGFLGALICDLDTVAVDGSNNLDSANSKAKFEIRLYTNGANQQTGETVFTASHDSVKAGKPFENVSLSADPSNPVNGWQYYNTTTHKLRLYANGAWVDLN